MKITRWISVFLCSWLVAQEPLIVGTNAEFPPFSYREGEKIVGFDIDIAQEIGRRLGQKVEFKDMPFEALLPELVLERVDFLAAGLTATEERAKRVSFTKPYLQGDPLVCLSLAKNAISFSEQKGKTILVNEGFTADLFVSALEGYNIIRLASTADAFIALQQGKGVSFVTAKSTVDSFFAQHGEKNFHVEILQTAAENCALAVAKNQKELLHKIQQVLDAMEEDGTLNQYKAKWKLQ